MPFVSKCIFIFFAVKLSGPQGLNSGNGSVLYYLNDTWARVCDEGFDDVTARRVCRELGFADGRSLCCSAYGDFSVSVLCIVLCIGFSNW